MQKEPHRPPDGSIPIKTVEQARAMLVDAHQPIGPNLRRSWMTAWKKQRPKTIGFHAHALGPVTLSKKVLSEIGSERYEPSRFARKPCGGSFVILTAFCRSSDGNARLGIEVSHKRKSLCVSSGLILSHSRSSSGNQLTAK